MKWKTTEYFPTLFYEFTWTEDEMRPLLEEMEEKKKAIKWKYLNEYAKDPEDRVDDYWTDHAGSVTLDEYNKLTEEVCNYWKPHLDVHLIAYWTAIYAKKGYHETHQHNPHPYETVGPNMSSVLYLSDIGVTQFYAPDQLSGDPDIFIQSEVGKLVIFPAHILHRAPPHMHPNEERIVISANWRISEAYHGGFWQARDEIVPMSASQREFHKKEKPFS